MGMKIINQSINKQTNRVLATEDMEDGEEIREGLSERTFLELRLH